MREMNCCSVPVPGRINQYRYRVRTQGETTGLELSKTRILKRHQNFEIQVDSCTGLALSYPPLTSPLTTFDCSTDLGGNANVPVHLCQNARVADTS